MIARLLPRPPEAIADLLAADSYYSIQRQIPTLHLVAILNLAIIVFVLWQQGIPPAYYAWMPLISGFNVWRLVQWLTRARRHPQPHQILRFLKGVNRATFGSVAIVSAISTWSYVAGLFTYPTLIPISLAFGTFSLAHCLAPLRFASMSSVVVGIFPSGIVMLLSGDMLSMVLGSSAMSVALLKLGFLRDHHSQMIVRLLLQKQNHELATIDPLTGLLNRRAFRQAIEIEIAARSVVSGGVFGVAMIDLDGFKAVNDTRGHHAGDALLMLVAERLVALAGSDAIVARLGGDEFAVLLRDVADAAVLSARMTGLLAGLCLPSTVAGAPVPIAASLGYALFPDSGRAFDTLLLAADEALYAAKRGGKSQARGHFQPAAQDRLAEAQG